MVFKLTVQYEDNPTIRTRENPKTIFFNKLGQIFSLDFQREGPTIAEIRRNCGVSMTFELSENRNGFRFVWILTEI